MEKIDLTDLAGYEVDAQGLRNFQRPYLIPSLIGLGVTLLGFLLAISEMQASHYYRGQKPGFLDQVWFHFQALAREAGAPPLLASCLPATFFLGGLLFLAGTMLFMARATPVSSISGAKMEKYWNARPDPGAREIVYVDRSSRTYFRRVFATTGGPSPFVPPVR